MNMIVKVIQFESIVLEQKVFSQGLNAGQTKPMETSIGGQFPKIMFLQYMVKARNLGLLIHLMKTIGEYILGLFAKVMMIKEIQ